MSFLRAASIVALGVACHREPPPQVDHCSPLVAQMDAVLARAGRCETDADCAYYPSRTPDDAGQREHPPTAGVTDKASAVELERIGRLYTAAQCSPTLATSTQTWRYKTVRIVCEDKQCMGVTFF